MGCSCVFVVVFFNVWFWNFDQRRLWVSDRAVSSFNICWGFHGISFCSNNVIIVVCILKFRCSLAVNMHTVKLWGTLHRSVLVWDWQHQEHFVSPKCKTQLLTCSYNDHSVIMAHGGLGECIYMLPSSSSPVLQPPLIVQTGQLSRTVAVDHGQIYITLTLSTAWCHQCRNVVW